MEFDENLMAGRTAYRKIREAYKKYPGLACLLKDGPDRLLDPLTLYFMVVKQQRVADAARTWSHARVTNDVGAIASYMVDVHSHRRVDFMKGDLVDVNKSGIVIVSEYGLQASFFFVAGVCAHKWCSNKIILSHTDESVYARENSILLTCESM